MAGVVRFDVSVVGKPIGDKVGLTVLSSKPDLAGNRKKIASFWSKRSGHISLFTEGDYVLTDTPVIKRNDKGEAAFKGTAGEEKPIGIDLKKQ